MSNVYKLKVDIKLTQTGIVPRFVQYDKARLEFQIFDGGKIFPLQGYDRVEVAHRRPDGTSVVGVGSIENGLVVYDYQGSEMSQTGDVLTALSIYSGETKVSIHPFKVRMVEDLLKDADLEATQEYNILQSIILELESLNVVQLDNRIARTEIVSSSTPPSGNTMFWIDESAQ